jgi:two-component system nitrogen regulation response regulator NtrX
MASILVVDNEEIIRKMLIRMLQSDGHEISQADGATQAKAILECKAVDLILMDIYMPEMNGLALMKSINETYAGIQTILISGRHSMDAEEAAKRFGAYTFLKKPFTRSELLDIVKDALANKKPSADEE